MNIDWIIVRNSLKMVVTKIMSSVQYREQSKTTNVLSSGTNSTHLVRYRSIVSSNCSDVECCTTALEFPRGVALDAYVFEADVVGWSSQ